MKRTIVAIATFVLLVAGAAFGQNRGFGPPPGSNQNGASVQPADGPGPMGGVLIDFLGLTEDQQAQWQSLHEATRATIEPLIEQQRTIREQIHTALESGSADATAIGELMIQEYGIGEQIRATHESLQTSLKALLTADQQVKFEAFLAAQKLLGRGPGGPGPGPGGPCPNC